ncbi:hypothetical protein F5888DRAFT_1634783 [Russula emetica]|nr:hypothetical protein F5888DRAFT_1634783 [Russula emetica]
MHEKHLAPQQGRTNSPRKLNFEKSARPNLLLNSNCTHSRNNYDRTLKELIKKSEDFAKHSHEKHAAFAQLQSSYDALQEAHTSMEGSLKALRSAHNAQFQLLSRSLAHATYTSEVAGLWRLIEMVEAREAQSKAIVENVKQEWVTINDRVAAGVSRRSVG